MHRKTAIYLQNKGEINIKEPLVQLKGAKKKNAYYNSKIYFHFIKTNRQKNDSSGRSRYKEIWLQKKTKKRKRHGRDCEFVRGVVGRSKLT